MEEPTGIWVIIVPAWPVIGKIFVIPIIGLLIGFCFWALVRLSQRLKAGLEDYPLFEALYLCVFLGGFSYLSNAIL